MVRTDFTGILRRPLIVAPMAGDPSTVGLVAAVNAAGALGFLAAGYQSADMVASEIAALRVVTDEAFGVNVFVPGRPTTDQSAVEHYVASLTGDGAELRVAIGDAKGVEAGAHQGSLVDDGADLRERPLLALIEEVQQVSGLPSIAAGGIVTADQFDHVLAAGAVAAQCGTAFLRCPESGAHPAHKAALGDPRYGRDGADPSVQGAPRPGVGQPVRDRARRRTRCLPRDQQRDPTTPCRSSSPGRHRADEPVGRDGMALGLGPAGG